MKPCEYSCQHAVNSRLCHERDIVPASPSQQRLPRLALHVSAYLPQRLSVKSTESRRGWAPILRNPRGLLVTRSALCIAL